MKNSTPLSTIDFIKTELEKETPLWRARLVEFLRIPSISTSAQYKDDVLKAYHWLAQELEGIGFSIEHVQTPKYPVILARMKGPENSPHVMIYGHYDVQPADPESLWHHPPFEPFIDASGEIFARGAQDNKGQLWAVIQSIRVLKENGKLPCHVTLCIEGEEESGSAGLFQIADSIKDKLAADALLVVDVDVPAKDTPAVTLGCRGNITMTIELEGSSGDLHSGMHGGIVFNPLHALVQMLGKMRADDGSILIDGFYDDVIRYSEEEKKEFLLNFDAAAYEKTFGAKPCGGEKAFSPIESCWMRPTLEINGIQGGYTGDGFKTVIPAKAIAKVSCRLVPNQNPQKIAQMLQKKLRELAPEGMKLNMTLHGESAWARANPKSSIVKAAREAYSTAFGKNCACTLSGGSIPITAKLGQLAEAEILFMGYGLSDDNIHAPNEHYGTDRLITLAAIVAATLENYANISKEID